MSLKDIQSDITKYIKKNFKEYAITEAFLYEEVYSVKIIKADASETLVFDKEGKFEKKVLPAVPAEQPKPADSAPVIKDKPAKADSMKK